MWRATCRKVSRQACAKDFNPRPPWGGRHWAAGRSKYSSQFQSTPSVGRATSISSSRSKTAKFQSTPSVGRATCKKTGHLHNAEISIHALRGEGDLSFCDIQFATSHFNPRPPWGGRHCRPYPVRAHTIFQSTPSVGRATRSAPLRRPFRASFQSTPSVGRATSSGSPCLTANFVFQSTPSVGRATKYMCRYLWDPYHFNPRPPWGGRHCPFLFFQSAHHFNPRPPWGGRLTKIHSTRSLSHFNPRPPWGGRQTAKESRVQEMPFQSTPSVGRATPVIQTIKAIELFQSTPSVGRATRDQSALFIILFDFNPRPPWGGRLQIFVFYQTHRHFNPRPPWGGRPCGW